jgi:hypothetical protein
MVAVEAPTFTTAALADALVAYFAAASLRTPAGSIIPDRE